MFVRLTIAQIKMERIDEFIKLYEETVVPSIKSQKGYRGIYLLMDRKTGDGISMSLWDSEEDVIANEKSHHYQELVAKFYTFYAKFPYREGYEIVVQA